MSIFGRKKDKPRSRDRPNENSIPLWNVLTNLRAKHDLTGNESVFAAVSRIALTIASMPVHLYCGSEIQTGDPREMRLAYAPNSYLTPYTFKLALEASRNTCGVAYVMIVPQADGITMDYLDVLDPSRVQPLRSVETGEIWYKITFDDGSTATVHNSQIINLLYMSTDGVTAISPVEVLGGTLKYDNRVQEISLEQLEGVKDSIVLNYNTNLSKEKKEAYVEQFMNAYKRSRGHIIVLEGGVTADKIAGSMVDPKVLDVTNLTKRKVASVFNMPPRMLGDANSSGYSTSEQDIAEFLKLTILPIVTQWEQMLNRKLLTPSEIAKGYEFKFSLDALQRGDTDAMTNRHKNSIRNGVMRVNEARKELGLPPDPNGNELWISRDLLPMRTILEHPEMLLTGKSEPTSGADDENKK